MSIKLDLILLIDDNPHDILFHERAIEKANAAEVIIAKESALDALDYLIASETSNTRPDLILLDINMPQMNGWDFLHEYRMLHSDQDKSVIVMLTASNNPDDRLKASEIDIVSDLIAKPLSKAIVEEILLRFFSDRLAQ